MSSAIKKGEVVVMQERKEAQAPQNLEKALKEFNLPDDESLLIGWTHDRFGDAAKGYFLAGLGLIKLHMIRLQTFAVIIKEKFPYLNERTAFNYIAVTTAMLSHPCFAPISKERGGYSKLLTALRICSEAELLEADASGEIRGEKIEQLGKMSVRTLWKRACFGPRSTARPACATPRPRPRSRSPSRGSSSMSCNPSYRPPPGRIRPWA